MFWKIKIYKNWQFYTGSAFFCALFFAGYFISTQSWNGEFFVYLDKTYSSVNARNIANVEKQMDISASLLKGSQLKQESQKALVSASRVENQKDVIQFYLGHFLVQSPGGGSVLACQQYQTVDMIFIAPEVSFHGHAPKMVLQAKCAFKPDQPLQMGPFFIPKGEILSSPVNKQLFKIKDATLLFSHVSIQWPNRWILSQIRFINDKKNEDFTVSFSSKKEEDFLTLSLK